MRRIPLSHIAYKFCIIAVHDTEEVRAAGAENSCEGNEVR